MSHVPTNEVICKLVTQIFQYPQEEQNELVYFMFKMIIPTDCCYM